MQLQLAVGSRQSAVSSRQSAVNSQQSAVISQSVCQSISVYTEAVVELTGAELGDG